MVAQGHRSRRWRYRQHSQVRNRWRRALLGGQRPAALDLRPRDQLRLHVQQSMAANCSGRKRREERGPSGLPGHYPCPAPGSKRSDFRGSPAPGRAGGSGVIGRGGGVGDHLQAVRGRNRGSCGRSSPSGRWGSAGRRRGSRELHCLRGRDRGVPTIAR